MCETCGCGDPDVVPIEVPALRSRIEDIPLLVDIFFEEFAKQSQKEKKKMIRTGPSGLLPSCLPFYARRS